MWNDAEKPINKENMSIALSTWKSLITLTKAILVTSGDRDQIRVLRDKMEFREWRQHINKTSLSFTIKKEHKDKWR